MARILITGVNRGIGAALAAEARARGHEVLGTTRDGAGGTLALTLDDPDSIAGQLTGQVPGPLDILINNAGVIGPERQATTDMDWAGFAQTLAVNTMAPLAVAQACLPALRQAPGARILTVSSQMAYMGYAKSDRIAYRASKSAVNKVMQGLATDLAPEGIASILVDPGWVRTDMGGAEAEEEAADVAAGIITLAERTTLAETGKFFRFSGEERAF
ncbi:SDR family NAD(P)-dependent oxidoreductase [Dinoroseobacter sp. S76]|uniref:SDR family NAD(P)-dependent oxidoreductase n=1 Tax=Dinoroseobacter sp. S76 TaxID=3415124 RepID=UPI003C7E7216